MLLQVSTYPGPAATQARQLEPGMLRVDFIVEEQFHNCILHPTEQQYCGVDNPMDLVEELRAPNFGVYPKM